MQQTQHYIQLLTHHCFTSIAQHLYRITFQPVTFIHHIAYIAKMSPTDHPAVVTIEDIIEVMFSRLLYPDVTTIAEVMTIQQVYTIRVRMVLRTRYLQAHTFA